MAAKKRKDIGKVGIAPASLPAVLTEQNATLGASTSNATVRVTIPIARYPGIDEPYLQSFDLLRNNAYEAAFSLGRIANAFRFSQFLYYYRMLGSRLDFPPVFFDFINDCLSLIDNRTQSEIVPILINSMSRYVIPEDRDGPVDYEGLWRDGFNSEDRDRIPFFRHPLNERYNFSFDTRAEPGQTSAIIDQSGWLDWFESLYEKLRQDDRHLANWMFQGWNFDRLVRPELEIAFLDLFYHDPSLPSPNWVTQIVPATAFGPFDWTRMRCTAKGYRTQNPMDRNNKARVLCSLLGSSSSALKLPKSPVAFEKFVSNWVRRCAEEKPRTDQISAAETTPKGSAKEDLGETNGSLGLFPKSQQKKKKGTQEAAQKDVLKAFLQFHHRFESKEDLNQEPATMDEMKHRTGKSKPMISRYLRGLGFKSYLDYKRTCEDYQDLKSRLELLDGKLPEGLRTNRDEAIELTGDD